MSRHNRRRTRLPPKPYLRSVEVSPYPPPSRRFSSSNLLPLAPLGPPHLYVGSVSSGSLSSGSTSTCNNNPQPGRHRHHRRHHHHGSVASFILPYELADHPNAPNYSYDYLPTNKNKCGEMIYCHQPGPFNLGQEHECDRERQSQMHHDLARAKLRVFGGAGEEGEEEKGDDEDDGLCEKMMQYFGGLDFI